MASKGIAFALWTLGCKQTDTIGDAVNRCIFAAVGRVIAVRLSEAAIARLDRIAAQCRARYPVPVSRSAVLRIAIERGLEALEKKHRKRKT